MIARLAPVEQDGEAGHAALAEAERIAEALLFAAPEPLEERQIAEHLPSGVAVSEVLETLRNHYAGRGVNLVRVARKWTFRTSPDLAWLLSRQSEDRKKLSKPALETLAIIAYHQPVTRAEIEDVRGVAISKGTLDLLLETGWVRLRGRRRAPGRPVTYGTTEAFLLHFGLEQVGDLPGLDELRAAGLFDGRLPQGFGVPMPKDDPTLTDDEDPLEEDGEGEAAALLDDDSGAAALEAASSTVEAVDEPGIADAAEASAEADASASGSLPAREASDAGGAMAREDEWDMQPADAEEGGVGPEPDAQDARRDPS